MPYIVVKDLKACPISKPWAVKNSDTGDVRGRCHPTKARARDQQQALYAALRKEGKLREGEYFLAPMEHLFGDNAPTPGDTVRWVQAFPYDTWDHPHYGETTVTPQIAQQYVKNFKDNVRGQDLAINYDHGEDKSKGNKAAGWIKDVEARQDGFFVKVDFTPTAIEEIKNGEWRYFSSECFDTWVNPMNKEEYQYVLTGGALTNKPWVKGMLPINFSEVLTEQELEEVEKEFSVWSTAYVNNLPDSSFLYIEPGGKQDSEGKTTPRSLRHLPYKDANGKLDEAHVRNAIPRSVQMVGLSDSLKKSLQAKAQKILAGMKKMAELPVEDQVKFEELLQKTGIDIEFGESREWEHSDPGTGSPPAPRIDGTDGSTELDRTEGWRRPDLPTNYPDTLIEEPIGFAESYAVTALKTGIDAVTTAVSDPSIDPACKAKMELWLADAESMMGRNIGELGYADVRNLLYCMPDTNTSSESNPGDASTSIDYAEIKKKKKKLEGGTYMGELTEKDVQKLMHFFEVDDESKLVEAAQLKFGELDELKRAEAVKDQESQFAEQYPEMWDEHNKLMQQTREAEALTFSESVSKIRRMDGFALKDTKMGLTSKAKTDIAELHQKFSEKKATVKEFEDTIQSIVNGGIIEFGERGTGRGDSSTEGEGVPNFDRTAAGIAGARQMFAELTQKEMDSHTEWGELPYGERLMRAGDEVAKKHPDLAETYRHTTSA